MTAKTRNIYTSETMTNSVEIQTESSFFLASAIRMNSPVCADYYKAE